MPVEPPKPESLEQQVFEIHNEKRFVEVALAVFDFQYGHNAVYRQFCDALGRTPENVKRLTQVPFLPISFFKTHEIKTTSFEPEIVFESSGTTGTEKSRHFVRDVRLYWKSFVKAFEIHYGSPDQYCILGLLPSYLEREHSSLIYMVQELIHLTQHPLSGFYLYDFEKLSQTLTAAEKSGRRTLIIGVTYALLDFAERYPLPFKETVVMETGGMKGRRREITRNEVHELLQKAFGIDHIHSEYGMTELLSQAYAQKEGIFRTPPWMKVLIREEDDPLTIYEDTASAVSGTINVIDLANIYSCSFIATDDIGKLYSDRSFEVLGRLDNSDIRGCSLLAV